MAVYTPDLSAMTTGQEVSGFTKRFDASFSWTIQEEAGTPYGKVIRCPTEAASNQNGLTLDAIDADPDRRSGETFIQFKTKADITAASLYALFSAVSAVNTEGARVGADPKDSEVNGGRYNNGSFASFTSATAYTFEASTLYNLLTSATDDGGPYIYRAWLWKDGESQPALPQVEESNVVSSGSNLRGLFRFDPGPVDITYVSFSTGTDVADRPTSSVPTTRKSSTFDIEAALGSITTATLNGVDVFDHVTGQVGTTVSFAGAATDETTTSGEYSLVLGDGVGTETITVQVNVVGVAPSNNPLQKDGSALASLTGVQLRVTSGANINGTELFYSGTATTDASGNLSNIDLSSTAAADTDPVLLHMRTAAGDSIIATETVGLI